MREQLLVILGPTACGKTGVSIKLAQRLDGEIVSADSVAVYRGFAIGSARPSMEEQQGIPHHLLDCISCQDAGFSVARYKQLANAVVDDILARNKTPILVGGSGLYIDAVTAPMTYAVEADPALREKLNAEYLRDSEMFWQRLHASDPVTATRLHVHDQKRLVRAMEVCILTGKPFSAQIAGYAKQQHASGLYTYRKVGLCMARELLYQRIDARVDGMMQAGLLQEARVIYDQGLSRSLPAMKSIGYTQLFDYFDGSITLSAAVETIKRVTRRFAKRQLTWFRRDPSITWYDWEDYGDADALVKAILRDLEEDEP